MLQQRALGNLFVRRGLLDAALLDQLLAQQKERRHAARRAPGSEQDRDRGRSRADARGRVRAALRGAHRHRRGTHRNGHAPADHVRQDAPRPRRGGARSHGERDLRRSARHVGARRHPPRSTSPWSSRWRRPRWSWRRSTASTSARHDQRRARSRGREARGRRGGDRHPRLGRRRADHPLGETALLLVGGEASGLSDILHRARRARGDRALPGRRSALRRAPRAAPVHERGHRAREDHGRPQHRREAPAPGRPHFEEDRRSQHRRPRLDHPDEPGITSAS